MPTWSDVTLRRSDGRVELKIGASSNQGIASLLVIRASAVAVQWRDNGGSGQTSLPIADNGNWVNPITPLSEWSSFVHVTVNMFLAQDKHHFGDRQLDTLRTRT